MLKKFFLVAVLAGTALFLSACGHYDHLGHPGYHNHSSNGHKHSQHSHFQDGGYCRY